VPRSRFAEALRPLASRPYRLMWMGSTTSSIGDAVVQIALVFAILHVGGTASDIGVIAAVSTVARIAFVLAGGVWADRLRRQYVMLAADAVRGAVQAALAILLLTGHAQVWELGVGAALYGAAASFFSPALMALVPETVPLAELQQANSLLGLPQSFFSIGGPAAVRRRRRHLRRQPGVPGAAARTAAADAAARVVPGRPRRGLARARDPPLVLDHPGRARLR
jgi:MFS family permease